MLLLIKNYSGYLKVLFSLDLLNHIDYVFTVVASRVVNGDYYVKVKGHPVFTKWNDRPEGS